MTTKTAPRPQLTRDELQQLRWLLGGVLMILAVATVAYMDVEGWWLMSVTAAVAMLTTLNPRWPARVPRAVHLLAFPVMAGFFALDLWLRSELLLAMVRLDLMLLLYRALVYRKRRDDLQVIVLGLFLVVVAGVLTVSLLFAVHLVVYTAGALALLLVLTLIDCSPSDEAAANGDVGPPAWALHASWTRLLRRVALVADWRVVAVGVALFGGVIATSALLFLLIPRFQLDNGMFLDRFVTRKARTGFSDSIRFGDVTEIQQDTGVALHVDVDDPGEIPLAPYWRMLVLDHYENGAFRLSPALRLHRFNPPRTSSVVFGAARWRRDRVRWRVYLEPGVSRYLPLLGPYPQLKFAEPQTYQNAPAMALLALVKEPVTMTAYQVDAFDLSARPADPPGAYFSEDASAGLDPADVATLRQLVRTAVPENGKSTTAEFAARLSAWLRERHAYSLSPRIPAGPGDALVRWVDSREVGHCELFAGSFVLLARAAGYRARVVTGFRGGTWNAFSNSFTIRNSDAHAWAEIFDHTSGSWLRADPLELPVAAQSDPTARAGALARRTDRSWGARLDSLRVFWYRRVVSFDEQTQVQTLKVAKELAQSGLEQLRARFSHGATALKAWWHRPIEPRRAGVLASGGMVALLLILTWRRWRVALLRALSSRKGDGRDDPIRREAGRWLRRLTDPERHAEPAAAVVGDLQRLRFGSKRTWPDAARVFSAARRASKRRESSSLVGR